ncbi:MAG TPA: preprotein translocase subunit YajC [Bacteroidota bacterium]|jgi:preprotein translocase subunit YajC|nr:preprotein translocase subunit YajC [Bacteroidota bacterium]
MQPQAGSGGGGIFSALVPILLVFLIFYFMILRPQQKKQKDREKLLSGIQKGDKIITVGGMHGTVIGLEEKTVLVQITDEVKVKFERSAISTINRPGTDAVGKTS